jgi:hypothetical protein
LQAVRVFLAIRATDSRFCNGGIVTSPTVGLLAEKESEAIVPRRKLAASKAGRGILKSLRVHQPELKGMQQMSEWYSRRRKRKAAKV